MKTLIITGGLGFIGKNIIRFFATDKLYDKYYIIDKVTKVSDLRFYQDFLKSEVNLIKSCISEVNFQQIEGDLDVINFAAESHVDNSFSNAVEFTEQNVLNTHKMLDNLVHVKNRLRFIHISTDEVYGGDMATPCSEDAQFRPSNPYSASKASADLLVQTYSLCFGLNSAIIRANNLYGEFQHYEKVIPKAIFLASNKQKFYLHGDGLQTRHFLHCYDFYQAILTIMNNWDSGIDRIYNIAADHEEKIKDLVSFIYLEHNLSLDYYIIEGTDRPFNDKHYLVDDSKLRSLNWKPVRNFKHELKEIIKHRKILVL